MNRATKRETSVLVSETEGNEMMEAVAGSLTKLEAAPSIHPTALVGPGVQLGRGVRLGPRVMIGSNVTLGDRVWIDAGTYIGPDSRIGSDCRLGANVTLRERTELGCRVSVESGVVIGSDGFGFAPCSDGNIMKMPQVGHVVVGDDVVIGANTTIDRATMGETGIGNRVVLGALVQVAHNCEIGDDTVIGAMTGICGSATIGKRVRVGTNVGIVGHIHVGDDAGILDGAGVTRPIKPGEVVAGFPAVAVERHNDIQACLGQLPQLHARLREIERRLNGALGNAGGRSAKAPANGTGSRERA